MSMKRKKAGSSSKSIEDVEEKARGGDEDMCLLELPELVIECILERLPPDGLCRMAGVCSSLRDRCISDRLWERHMKRKWDRIIGPAVHREWHWHLAQYTSTKHNWAGGNGRRAGLVKSLYRLWPVSLIKSNSQNRNTCLPAGSVMSWYLALETGKFSFPAQVYNRENGHVGFILSCYDAELCYDPRTDTFQARYPPHGRRAAGAVENGVSWDRVRAPPVDTCSPHDLHISDCLNELRPGDHIEIQWRRNKDYPYGWWYGIVGHLESCDTTTTYGLCNCHQRDSVVLEFNQYTPGSRWRLTSINRNEHREEGNEEDGFYGGIRKLRTKDEISLWARLWPAQVLE